MRGPLTDLEICHRARCGVRISGGFDQCRLHDSLSKLLTLGGAVEAPLRVAVK